MTRRAVWAAIAGMTVLAFAFRLAGAQGALWLDEAWSAVMANQVGSIRGVLFNINHDNNHHLNSLWLLLVGLDAPPWLQRGLSIVTGTAAVPLAALIGWRRSPVAALIAALFFAISPILVGLGSEARGYAPMIVAALGAMLMVLTWLDDPSQRPPAIPLAVVVLLGMFSHLLMIFVVAALAMTIAISLLSRMPLRQAIARGSIMVLPALAAAGSVLLLIALAARASTRGFQIGSYVPFTWPTWVEGVTELGGFACGNIAAFAVGAVLVVHHAADVRRWPGAAGWLLIVSALAIPLAQIGNAAMPRYYLPLAVALLLLLAEALARLLARGGASRIAGGVVLAVLVGSMLVFDLEAIRNRRADPGMALTYMQRHAPGGTTVALDHSRTSAVLEAAGASAGYPLRIVEDCTPAPFLFVDRNGGESFPATPVHCGHRYRPVASARATKLSGTHWVLYQRVDGPAAKTSPN